MREERNALSLSLALARSLRHLDVHPRDKGLAELRAAPADEAELQLLQLDAELDHLALALRRALRVEREVAHEELAPRAPAPRARRQRERERTFLTRERSERASLSRKPRASPCAPCTRPCTPRRSRRNCRSGTCRRRRRTPPGTGRAARSRCTGRCRPRGAAGGSSRAPRASRSRRRRSRRRRRRARSCTF